MNKKTLIATGVIGLIGIIAVAGTRKVAVTANVMDQLKIRLSGIDWNSLQFKNPNAQVNINLRILNPTNYDFTVNSLGMATVRRVLIKDHLGNIIAKATVNLEKIAIPANGSTVLRDLKIEGKGLTLLPLLRSFNGVTTSIELDVLGTTYIIQNDNTN